MVVESFQDRVTKWRKPKRTVVGAAHISLKLRLEPSLSRHPSLVIETASGHAAVGRLVCHVLAVCSVVVAQWTLWSRARTKAPALDWRSSPTHRDSVVPIHSTYSFVAIMAAVSHEATDLSGQAGVSDEKQI